MGLLEGLVEVLVAAVLGLVYRQVVVEVQEVALWEGTLIINRCEALKPRVFFGRLSLWVQSFPFFELETLTVRVPLFSLIDYGASLTIEKIQLRIDPWAYKLLSSYDLSQSDELYNVHKNWIHDSIVFIGQIIHSILGKTNFQEAGELELDSLSRLESDGLFSFKTFRDDCNFLLSRKKSIAVQQTSLYFVKQERIRSKTQDVVFRVKINNFSSENSFHYERNIHTKILTIDSLSVARKANGKEEKDLDILSIGPVSVENDIFDLNLIIINFKESVKVFGSKYLLNLFCNSFSEDRNNQWIIKKPSRPVISKLNAAAWWRFAVSLSMKKRNGNSNWKSILIAVARRRLYTKLYKKYLVYSGNLLPREISMFYTLESEIPQECILRYRYVVHRELRLNNLDEGIPSHLQKHRIFHIVSYFFKTIRTPSFFGPAYNGFFTEGNFQMRALSPGLSILSKDLGSCQISNCDAFLDVIDGVLNCIICAKDAELHFADVSGTLKRSCSSTNKNDFSLEFLFIERGIDQEITCNFLNPFKLRLLSPIKNSAFQSDLQSFFSTLNIPHVFRICSTNLEVQTPYFIYEFSSAFVSWKQNATGLSSNIEKISIKEKEFGCKLPTVFESSQSCISTTDFFTVFLDAESISLNDRYLDYYLWDFQSFCVNLHCRNKIDLHCTNACITLLNVNLYFGSNLVSFQSSKAIGMVQNLDNLSEQIFSSLDVEAVLSYESRLINVEVVCKSSFINVEACFEFLASFSFDQPHYDISFKSCEYLAANWRTFTLILEPCSFFSKRTVTDLNFLQSFFIQAMDVYFLRFNNGAPDDAIRILLNGIPACAETFVVPSSSITRVDDLHDRFYLEIQLRSEAKGSLRPSRIRLEMDQHVVKYQRVFEEMVTGNPLQTLKSRIRTLIETVELSCELRNCEFLDTLLFNKVVSQQILVSIDAASALMVSFHDTHFHVGPSNEKDNRFISIEQDATILLESNLTSVMVDIRLDKVTFNLVSFDESLFCGIMKNLILLDSVFPFADQAARISLHVNNIETFFDAMYKEEKKTSIVSANASNLDFRYFSLNTLQISSTSVNVYSHHNDKDMTSENIAKIDGFEVSLVDRVLAIKSEKMVCNVFSLLSRINVSDMMRIVEPIEFDHISLDFSDIALNHSLKHLKDPACNFIFKMSRIHISRDIEITQITNANFKIGEFIAFSLHKNMPLQIISNTEPFDIHCELKENLFTISFQKTIDFNASPHLIDFCSMISRIDIHPYLEMFARGTVFVLQSGGIGCTFYDSAQLGFPFLKLELTHSYMKTRFSNGTKNTLGLLEGFIFRTTTSSYYFNQAVGYWEPFLEPCDIEFSFRKEPYSTPQSNYDLRFQTDLRLNISTEIVNTLSKLFLSSIRTRILFLNKTGRKLHIFQNSGRSSHVFFDVSSNQSLLYDSVSCKPYVNEDRLQILVDGFPQLLELNLCRAGLISNNLWDLEGKKVQLVLETFDRETGYGIERVVIAHSCLEIANLTSYNFEYSFSADFFEVFTILSSEANWIPLHLINAKLSIFIKPAGEYQPATLEMSLDTELSYNNIFKCKAKQGSEASGLEFSFSVINDAKTHTKRVAIEPFLTLMNTLPVTIFLCEDGGKADGGNTWIPIHENCIYSCFKSSIMTSELFLSLNDSNTEKLSLSKDSLHSIIVKQKQGAFDLLQSVLIKRLNNSARAFKICAEVILKNMTTFDLFLRGSCPNESIFILPKTACNFRSSLASKLQLSFSEESSWSRSICLEFGLSGRIQVPHLFQDKVMDFLIIDCKLDLSSDLRELAIYPQFALLNRCSEELYVRLCDDPREFVLNSQQKFEDFLWNSNSQKRSIQLRLKCTKWSSEIPLDSIGCFEIALFKTFISETHLNVPLCVLKIFINQAEKSPVELAVEKSLHIPFRIINMSSESLSFRQASSLLSFKLNSGEIHQFCWTEICFPRHLAFQISPEKHTSVGHNFIKLDVDLLKIKGSLLFSSDNGYYMVSLLHDDFIDVANILLMNLDKRLIMDESFSHSDCSKRTVLDFQNALPIEDVDDEFYLNFYDFSVTDEKSSLIDQVLFAEVIFEETSIKSTGHLIKNRGFDSAGIIQDVNDQVMFPISRHMLMNSRLELQIRIYADSGFLNELGHKSFLLDEVFNSGGSITISLFEKEDLAIRFKLQRKGINLNVNQQKTISASEVTHTKTLEDKNTIESCISSGKFEFGILACSLSDSVVSQRIYCELEYNKSGKYSQQVDLKHPIWNECFLFSYLTGQKILCRLFRVAEDRDVDELMGVTVIDPSSFILLPCHIPLIKWVGLVSPDSSKVETPFSLLLSFEWKEQKTTSVWYYSAHFWCPTIHVSFLQDQQSNCEFLELEIQNFVLDFRKSFSGLKTLLSVSNIVLYAEEGTIIDSTWSSSDIPIPFLQLGIAFDFVEDNTLVIFSCGILVQEIYIMYDFQWLSNYVHFLSNIQNLAKFNLPFIHKYFLIKTLVLSEVQITPLKLNIHLRLPKHNSSRRQIFENIIHALQPTIESTLNGLSITDTIWDSKNFLKYVFVHYKSQFDELFFSKLDETVESDLQIPHMFNYGNEFLPGVSHALFDPSIGSLRNPFIESRKAIPGKNSVFDVGFENALIVGSRLLTTSVNYNEKETHERMNEDIRFSGSKAVRQIKRQLQISQLTNKIKSAVEVSHRFRLSPRDILSEKLDALYYFNPTIPKIPSISHLFGISKSSLDSRRTIPRLFRAFYLNNHFRTFSSVDALVFKFLKDIGKLSDTNELRFVFRANNDDSLVCTTSELLLCRNDAVAEHLLNSSKEMKLIWDINLCYLLKLPAIIFGKILSINFFSISEGRKSDYKVPLDSKDSDLSNVTSEIKEAVEQFQGRSFYYINCDSFSQEKFSAVDKISSTRDKVVFLHDTLVQCKKDLHLLLKDIDSTWSSLNTFSGSSDNEIVLKFHDLDTWQVSNCKLKNDIHEYATNETSFSYKLKTSDSTFDIELALEKCQVDKNPNDSSIENFKGGISSSQLRFGELQNFSILFTSPVTHESFTKCVSIHWTCAEYESKLLHIEQLSREFKVLRERVQFIDFYIDSLNLTSDSKSTASDTFLKDDKKLVSRFEVLPKIDPKTQKRRVSLFIPKNNDINKHRQLKRGTMLMNHLTHLPNPKLQIQKNPCNLPFKKLSISIIEVTNISYRELAPEFYCEFRVGDIQNLFRTSIIKSTSQPVWNETFTVDIPSESQDSTLLTFSLFRKRVLSLRKLAVGKLLINHLTMGDFLPIAVSMKYLKTKKQKSESIKLLLELRKIYDANIDIENTTGENLQPEEESVINIDSDISTDNATGKAEGADTNSPKAHLAVESKVEELNEEENVQSSYSLDNEKQINQLQKKLDMSEMQLRDSQNRILHLHHALQEGNLENQTIQRQLKKAKKLREELAEVKKAFETNINSLRISQMRLSSTEEKLSSLQYENLLLEKTINQLSVRLTIAENDKKASSSFIQELQKKNSQLMEQISQLESVKSILHGDIALAADHLKRPHVHVKSGFASESCGSSADPEELKATILHQRCEINSLIQIQEDLIEMIIGEQDRGVETFRALLKSLQKSTP